MSKIVITQYFISKGKKDDFIAPTEDFWSDGLELEGARYFHTLFPESGCLLREKGGEMTGTPESTSLEDQ